MKTSSLHSFLRTAAAAIAIGPLAALSSGAVVVQTVGSGTAVTVPQFSATFSANLTLANPYSEGGLTFSHTGFADDNGGCGYAGVDCEASPGDGFSQAFSGNYFGTAGTGAYVSVVSGSGPLNAVEFAVDSGFLTINVMWETWLGGTRTASGRVSLGNGGVGGVIGLADPSGFNEVRVFAFDSATDTSGYSTAAIDNVVASAVASAVPEPRSWALALTGVGLVAFLVRRRGALA